MAMKGYSAFPKDPLSRESHHQIVSYPGHALVGSYPGENMQSVCSTVPADWEILVLMIFSYFFSNVEIIS